jgi:hypothetical protein
MERSDLVLAVFAQVAGLLAASEPQPLTLDALLEKFKQMPGLEAHFREEKRITLLAAPLVSEGLLYFAPPARLARHTFGPEKSIFLIDGRTLSFGDEQTREEVDLDANPAVRDHVDSLLMILAGDRDSIVRKWRIEISGQVESWEITLQPTSEPLKKTIREMTLRGKGVVVQWMRVVETTGDETVTRFSQVNPTRRFSQAEADRLFRIPPS